MEWIAGAFVALLLAGLTRFFVYSARVIRKDIDERFKQIEVGLENEANSIMRHLLNQHR